MTRFYHSLRWKLQLWHGLFLLVVIAGLVFTFYGLERQQAFVRLDRRLQGWSPRIMESLGRMRPPPPPWEEPRRPENNFMEELTLPEAIQTHFEKDGETQAYYTVWGRSGELITFSDTAPKTVPFPTRGPADAAFRTRESWREFAHFARDGRVVLVGIPMAELDSELLGLLGKMIGIGSAILGLGLVGGWWFISRAIRPIGQIQETASGIAEGRLYERVPIQDHNSELGQLAETLNQTFGRLEDIFNQQVRFTADASHELRTPITVIRSKTQIILSRDRSPEEYREAIAVCLRAAARMSHLIESLLELARIDSGELKTELAQFSIHEVLQDAIEEVRPLATEAGIEIEYSDTELDGFGVALWTRQVLTNLILNAVRYSQAPATVHVRVTDSKDRVEVAVIDEGQGIDADELPHIFDRFYRVRSETEATNGPAGSGLGLAICQGLMKAQGGSIHAESTPGKGSTFSIRLPGHARKPKANDRTGLGSLT